MRTITDQLRENADFCQAQIVGFGELHQTNTFQSEFHKLFFEVIDKNDFGSVAVELRHDSYDDFMGFVNDSSSLAAYREQWAKPGTALSYFSDSYFENLKTLSLRGIKLLFLNRAKEGETTRDAFMASRVKDHVKSTERCAVLLGSAHVLRRSEAQEKYDWESAMEKLSEFKIYSLAEAGFRSLLERNCDSTLCSVLERNSGVKLFHAAEYGSLADMVLFETNTATRVPQCIPQRVLIRAKHFDCVFFDFTRFSGGEWDRLKKAKLVDYSGQPTLTLLR